MIIIIIIAIIIIIIYICAHNYIGSICQTRTFNSVTKVIYRKMTEVKRVLNCIQNISNWRIKCKPHKINYISIF